MDGATFEMFLERVGNHPRCCINYDPSHFLLQQLDYLGFIDVYHERIKASRQGRRVQPQPQARRYTGLPALAANRAGRFRRRSATVRSTSALIFQARRLRLRQLGGAGMGVPA